MVELERSEISDNDKAIQLTKNITYGDLVKQFVKLNQTDKFEKAAVGRYINFLSEFLRNEEGATKQQAIREWKKLKTWNIEKTINRGSS